MLNLVVFVFPECKANQKHVCSVTDFSGRTLFSGDLRVQGFAYPSDTVYVGGNVKLFCCINIDPRSFVAEDGVKFFQICYLLNTQLVMDNYCLDFNILKGHLERIFSRTI